MERLVTKKYRLKFHRPTTVREIYEEGRGLGVYAGIPIDGGLLAAEARFKTKWRKHWDNKAQKRLSRILQVVGAVEKKLGEGEDLDVVLEHFQEIFVSRKLSFEGLISEFKSLGLLIVRS